MFLPDGLKDVVVAIAHRGRLNLLTLLMNYPPVVMFQKVSSVIVSLLCFSLSSFGTIVDGWNSVWDVCFQMKGKREFPPGVVGDGDVLSHLSKLCSVCFSFFLQLKRRTASSLCRQSSGTCRTLPKLLNASDVCSLFL